MALDRCDEVLKPLLDVPLLDVLWKDEHCDLLNHTKYSQPAIFSIQHLRHMPREFRKVSASKFAVANLQAASKAIWCSP